MLAALWVWLDGARILGRLAAAQPGWVLLALVLVQAQTMASAWRWWATARALGGDLGWCAAVRDYYVAGLLNLTLPGGVAGDAARIARARARATGGGWRGAAAPVMIERLAGQVAIWMLAAVGLAIAPLTLEAPLWVSGCGAGAALVGTLLVLRVARASDGIGDLLRRAWIAGGAWRLQLPLSPLIASSYVAVFALCAQSLGQDWRAGALLTLVPLALLAMAVPLSIGGWGLREGAAAALWPLAGLAAADGVSAAALYGLVCLAGALPGALFLWPGRR